MTPAGCLFDRLSQTLFSLFWSMFGLIGVDSVEIKYPSKDQHTSYAHVFPRGVDSVEIKYPSKDQHTSYAHVFPRGSHATSVVETVGMFLFALYHVSTIVVLINMLIAMMSHSFEAIQVNIYYELYSCSRSRSRSRSSSSSSSSSSSLRYLSKKKKCGHQVSGTAGGNN